MKINSINLNTFYRGVRTSYNNVTTASESAKITNSGPSLNSSLYKDNQFDYVLKKEVDKIKETKIDKKI